MDAQQLSDLIGKIYDTAVDASEWADVMVDIGRALDSPKSALLSISTDSLNTSVFLFPGWDPAEVVRYERDYAAINPMVIDAARRPDAVVRADTLLPDYDNYRRGPVYNEMFAPNAAQHLIGCFLSRENGSGLACAFHRGSDKGPHSQADHHLFATILPHLLRSLRLRRHFCGVRMVRRGLGEAIDRMTQAVALLGRDSQVVELNGRAEALLAMGDGLAIRGGRLVADNAETNAVLRRLIATTAGANGKVLPPARMIVRVPRSSCRRPYVVTVAKVPAQKEWELSDSRIALVFVHDPEAVPRPAEEVVAFLHGLTPAEAQAAVAIATGHTVKEYAAMAKVTENTARWRLKQVMAKTECRTQAQLVRVVLSGPAVLRAKSYDQ